MERIIKTIIHTLEVLILATGTVYFANIISIPLLLMALIPASKLHDDLNGNEIKNSIFSVSKKGYIAQNTLSKPSRFLKTLLNKNKQEAFTNEILNMFLELKKDNKKGEPIKYNTKSHIITLRLLQMLQRNGYISDLQYEKKNKSSLVIEKLLMGNLKGINLKKKTQMFKISFFLTDKNRSKEELLQLLNPSKKEETKPTTDSKPEEPQITQENNLQQKKEELIKLKEELECLKEHQQEQIISEEETPSIKK